jgi:hypothetical protein
MLQQIRNLKKKANFLVLLQLSFKLFHKPFFMPFTTINLLFNNNNIIFTIVKLLFIT